MRYPPLKKSAPIVDKRMWITIFVLQVYLLGFMSVFLFYLGAGSFYAFDFNQMRNDFLNLVVH